jgi:hypothetical protein
MAKIINFRRLERLEKKVDAMDTETTKLSVSREEWEKLTPGQKQGALLDDALDAKREMFELPRPEEFDAQFHTFLAKLSESTINQVLQIEANALHRPQSDELDRVLEERRIKAIEAIKRMTQDG